MPYIGLLHKVIHLNLILDMYLVRSSEDVSRRIMLRFRFRVSKRNKTDLQCCGDVFFDILISKKPRSFGPRYVLMHFESLLGF